MLTGCLGGASSGTGSGYGAAGYYSDTVDEGGAGGDSADRTQDGAGTGADADGQIDAFVPKTLQLPTKCPLKDKPCLSQCMDTKCAGLEAACDDSPECKSVSSCVKNTCEWKAYDCINKCIYKTYSTKAGKTYKAMIDCAADKCILQECGDGFCLGKETPLECPQDCRQGAAGPGSCSGRCGAYVKGATCQCDKACEATGDCCKDHSTVCDVPDVALISVSGHSKLGVVTGEKSSKNYLRFTGDAVPTIRGKLEGLGLQVKEFGFIDSFHSWDDGNNGDIDRRGFLSLVETLEWIHTYWVSKAKHPAKVVVVAHSHGAVWAHLALMLVPQLEVQVLVTLDGACNFWVDYHANDVVDYVNKHGDVFGVPVWSPCDKWKVPGFTKLRDAEDIVPANVVLNLEVRAQKGLPNDDNSNLRLDGSKTGITTFSSPNVSHSNVHKPGSAGMNWVLQQLPTTGW